MNTLKSPKQQQAGLTLVELMVVIAILSIIAALAIPAYDGYVKEARLSTARANMDSLRLFLEDYRLDNGTYISGAGANPSLAQLSTNYGWTPDGDTGAYTYGVSLSANSYDITVTSDGLWMRCENRMSNCCDGKGNVIACP
ncbi:MAG: type IV pilin protein [Chromatiales bacterium]|jgi:prepilin-type N-terminal cleavage/methylation domain-containing protein